FAAQHAITEVLAESSSVEDALPRLLPTLGESMGWKTGGFWTLDSECGELACQTVWRARSFAGRSLMSTSKETTFAPWQGLPGRVWASRRPAWVEDVLVDSNFARA